MIRLILILIIVYLVMRDKSLQDKIMPIYHNIINKAEDVLHQTNNHKENSNKQINDINNQIKDLVKNNN